MPAVVRRRRRTAQASEAGPPTAPLIRLQLTILDRPSNPYRFESFLNVAAEHQARVLAQLAGQERLYLAFYGDDLNHRFTKVVNHDRQQWQYLDELVAEALSTGTGFRSTRESAGGASRSSPSRESPGELDAPAQKRVRPPLLMKSKGRITAFWCSSLSAKVSHVIPSTKANVLRAAIRMSNR
jgi:hypothetical protein